LFWLDGHYSGGITARSAAETPILQELQCVLRHRVRTHVILIDDARCFTGANGYPTIAALRELLAGAYPSWLFTVGDDIIRMHPPMAGGRRLTAATAPASRTCTADAQAGPRAGTLAQGAAAPRDWAGPTTGAEQTCG
jgi:hypothetical protein